MDLYKVLSQLHEELDRLNAAILSLERLQQENRRRGHTPKVVSEVTKASQTGRKGDAERVTEEPE
jgi:hypothetical protein